MRAVTEAMFTIFPREAVSSGSCVNICVKIQDALEAFKDRSSGRGNDRFQARRDAIESGDDGESKEAGQVPGDEVAYPFDVTAGRGLSPSILIAVPS